MDLTFHAEGWEGQRACWSYEGFNTFRKRLVALSGVVLEEMQGFGGSRSWKGVPLGGIGELIRHYDDAGILTAPVCGRMAPNLLSLLERLNAAAAGDDGVSYDVQMGRILTQMMEHCAERGVPLEFIGAPVNARQPMHHHHHPQRNAYPDSVSSAR